MARCATTTWRGVTVCIHSVAKLNAWAASTGSAIYIKPIQGCYSTAVKASAETHAGGGVYDVEMDPYTFAQFNYSVNQGRKQNLITMGRWWAGNHHIHLIDPACPTLSSDAVDQVNQWLAGETGLVGHDDKDTWDRTQLSIMKTQFVNRLKPAYVPKPVTPAKTYNFNYPYQRRAGWFPYPGKAGASYYGPSSSGKPWYSGKVGGGTNVGTDASGGLTRAWVQGHISRIQRCVGVKADNSYGPVTVKAVKAWQKKYKLPVDGIVGPKTWAAMAKSRNQGM